jgi:hypothetical protein
MSRRIQILLAVFGVLLLGLAAAQKQRRPPFLGTWVKGSDVLSFNSDGSYFSGGRSGDNDHGTLGRWKRIGRHALEMDGTRVDWKLSEDGQAMFYTVTMPKELQGLFGSEPRSTVYTRR